MSKSFYVYIHDEASGHPDWKKCGKGMTPYSVVRSRQKSSLKKICLNHLYFGNPMHVEFLENQFKNKFGHLSGSTLNEISSQTELFNMTEKEIITELDIIIKNNDLHIMKLELDQPYSAANSGECPMKIPSEAKSYDYHRNIVIKRWGSCEDVKITKSTKQFNNLFTVILEEEIQDDIRRT
jgi:hypothetical protein